MMLPHHRSFQINYLCGWQYCFSPKFRSEVHEKWGDNTWLRSLCILGGLGGMVISLAVFTFVVMAFWEMFNHI